MLKFLFHVYSRMVGYKNCFRGPVQSAGCPRKSLSYRSISVALSVGLRDVTVPFGKCSFVRLVKFNFHCLWEFIHILEEFSQT